MGSVFLFSWFAGDRISTRSSFLGFFLQANHTKQQLIVLLPLLLGFKGPSLLRWLSSETQVMAVTAFSAVLLMLQL